MDDAIKQIGQRLKGLREVLDIPVEEMAAVCEVCLDEYLNIESGATDPSVSFLSKISKRYDISLDVLLFGEEPHMSTYFLTRKGQGLSVERRKAYKYQSLAAGFRGRKTDPFLVQVDPKPDDAELMKYSHEGQEFDMVLEGTLEISIGNKVMTMNGGDSIYFEAAQPHCMRALGGVPVIFISVVI